MARKRKGRPVSGWVILDKPVGMGSTQCVSKIKWLYKAAKAGHAGTLDPLASGMLPIALGEATKTVPHIMDGNKSYRFSVAWGKETNTDDTEGEVVHTSALRPGKEDIEKLIPNYVGDIEQVPPAYSAVKIGGERAYNLAREGKSPTIAARTVNIDRLSLVETSEDESVFEATCGKGTYVRALARDMGRDLGCFGHITALRRTSVGAFREEEMVELQDLEDLEGDLDSLDAELFATGTALESMPEIPVNEGQARKLRLGNPVLLRGSDAIVHAQEAFASLGDELVAIGTVEKGSFQPRRVFHASWI